MSQLYVPNFLVCKFQLIAVDVVGKFRRAWFGVFEQDSFCFAAVNVDNKGVTGSFFDYGLSTGRHGKTNACGSWSDHLGNKRSDTTNDG